MQGAGKHREAQYSVVTKYLCWISCKLWITSHLNEANPNHTFEIATQEWPIMQNRKTQRLPPPMGTPKLQPFTEKLLMEKNHKTSSKDLQPPQDPTPSTSCRQPPYKAGPGNQPNGASSTPARRPTVGSLLQQKDPCSPHGVHPYNI